MVGKSHFRVRGVKCGKCERIHTWYKYRVWREGKKVKEEYIGKCDASGNDDNADAKRYWENVWQDYAKQWEQAYTYTRQQAYTTLEPERKRTPYEILGVSYTATTEQITTAYRTLVKKYHPDLNPGIDQRIITEINVAYHILTH